MDRINKVSIIGLGAIGAAYASILSDMDPQSIQVIADQHRIERYKASNFEVNDQAYQFQYISPEEVTERSDLILVAVKYDGLDQAIIDMKHHVGPGTIILSLMNGIDSEEILAAEFGGENILYGMCLGIDAVRVGKTIQFSNIGKVWFGEPMNSTHSANVQLVKELFDRANIPYEIPKNMLRTMWWKFMINVGLNQTSAILRAPYRIYHEVEDARQLMAEAMKEVIVLAQQVGVDLTNDDVEEFGKVLKNLSPEGKTSMLQDIEAGRKTEVEYLGGKVCEMGRSYGIATPTNDMLYKMIRILEQRNSIFSK
jgi:2-dehydropantoate 2-reductase